MNGPHDLPDDPESLKALVLAAQADAKAARAELLIAQLTNEKLRFEIAVLRRARFGRSSEALDRELEQLELSVEDLEASVAEFPAARLPAAMAEKVRPVRRALPPELPREEIRHEAACACPGCGGALAPAGSDVAEMLEWVPGRYKVIRHVRPKYSCARCETLVQAAAPARPIARGLAGPGLLAHVLVSKYTDHLPLYRQSAIFARDGIDLDRSTLADWVGGAAALLSPLVEALGRYVMTAEKLHGDDTPVPVLAPGRKTREGRLWTYVRDDRPGGSKDPPAVVFRYSPDRKGEHPREHLRTFRGVLHADGYAGFERLYGERIQEAACWAHYPESHVMRSGVGVRLCVAQLMSLPRGNVRAARSSVSDLRRSLHRQPRVTWCARAAQCDGGHPFRIDGPRSGAFGRTTAHWVRPRCVATPTGCIGSPRTVTFTGSTSGPS